MKLSIHGRLTRRAAALGLTCALAFSAIPFAGAVTQEQIDQMNSVQSQINDLQDKQNSALDQSLLYQQQLELLSEQISDTQSVIDDYSVQIDETQVQLEEAQAKAEQYYQLFCERVRDMEEQGSVSYWSILFDAANFSDLLDRINFIKDVVHYDNGVVDALEAARQEVADTEAQLEQEKAGQEEALSELETQQSAVADASAKNDALIAEIQSNQDVYAAQLAQIESQRSDLDADIVASEAEYQAQLEEARKQAEAAEKARQAEEKRKAEEKRRQEEAAAAANNKNNNTSNNTSNSSNSSSSSSSSSSSVSGAEIVAYAQQFIGNPYVWGGTSLTNGCDCSGFTMRVYGHFGISLEHYSGSQRYAGRGISYSEAEPGDLICYSGHVAIYIGGGMVVNAIDEAHGIGISRVNTSRAGFCVRRLI